MKTKAISIDKAKKIQLWIEFHKNSKHEWFNIFVPENVGNDEEEISNYLLNNNYILDINDSEGDSHGVWNWGIEKIEIIDHKFTSTKKFDYEKVEKNNKKEKVVILSKPIQKIEEIKSSNVTYLLENGGLVTERLLKWVTSFDKNYKEINTDSNRFYMRSGDLWFFAMLINPKLERIVTSSAFMTPMPHEATVSFNKEDDKQMFMQIEYFTWLIYEAVGFRKQNNIQPLNIEINYQGVDFLKDLKKETVLGKDTTTYLKLMLRQSEGHVKLNIYSEYKLKYTLITEEDLKL